LNSSCFRLSFRTLTTTTCLSFASNSAVTSWLLKRLKSRLIFQGADMTKVRTYDAKSYELAEYFLQDEPELNNEKAKHSLALNIQQTVEDEIYFMRQGIFSE